MNVKGTFTDYLRSLLSRAREEELVYVLEKLRTLKIWPGSLWAALSQSPTQYSVEQPGKPNLPATQTHSMLISTQA